MGWIDFILRRRSAVFLLVVTLTVGGLWAAWRLPMDVVPDVTPNQVQVNTECPGWVPNEVERLVSYPIEVAMGNLPHAAEVRSLSKYGLSQVTVVFEEGTDTWFARQLVFQRLQEVSDSIPAGLEPEMGPVTTGLGEIFHYVLEGNGQSLMELRTIQDWVVRPRLRAVPGLAEINGWGGYVKQYQVIVDPKRLLTYGLALRQVYDALSRNNVNVSAAYVEHASEQYLIRGVGRLRNEDDIRRVVVTAHEGTPVYVGDVATVGEGPEIRSGAATMDGRGEVVIGVAMLLKGENSRSVVQSVRQRVDEIQKSLPPGVKIRPFYDRAELITSTVSTVLWNLVEGGTLVALVLLALLGNVRVALIVAAVIPVSMLGAVVGMQALGISGNLMSLGAIDFGLLVDGAIVVSENTIRLLREEVGTRGRPLAPAEVLDVVRRALAEVVQPVIVGVGIVTLVYLPILTLQGIEGKMFRPMAITVTMALALSLLLALTWVPAACASFIGGRLASEEPRWMAWMESRYEGFLRRARRFRPLLVANAALVFIAGLALFARLGAEFLPRLDEGAIALQFRRLPSVSLSEAVRQSLQVEKLLHRFPEVTDVVTRTGTAEIATDPMGPEMSDVWVLLKPRGEWTTARTKEELVEKMEAVLKQVPGVALSFSQPIELRFNELISGVRSDLGVNLFGEDYDVLRARADDIARVLASVPGAADVRAEQISGLPVLEVRVNREALARFGLDAAEVLETVETAIGGRQATVLLEGDRRFAVQVRLPESARLHPRDIGELLISTPGGGRIPLQQIAEIKLTSGPVQVTREHGERRVTIEANIRGRDMAGFVDEARARVEREVTLPPGYYTEWGGQFENFERGRNRLMIVVPVVLLAIFFMLLGQFGSVRQALLVYTGVPFAVCGGVFALWLRGMSFSISAGVGFVALCGVAVLNGVVMVSFINQLRRQGCSVWNSVVEGAGARLRPVLTTALVASLGFIPMAFAHGTGAEVQRPLATVVVGGLLTSTVLTLVLLPLMYDGAEREED